MIELNAEVLPAVTAKEITFTVANQVKVILNPFGGRWPGPAKQAKVEEALQQAGLAYHLELTQGRGHALELAQQAAQAGWPVVIAAGGDGTINEVVNGLMQAAGEAEAGTLGIIPLGTANDLAAALNIPLDPLAACRRLAAGQTRLIDLGQVNGHYFVNNSAMGLEPMVTLAYNRLRWISGVPRYLVAAVLSIIRAKPWLMRLTWNNSAYDGPVALVSVGNSNRTGGMFYLTPQAKVDDGLLDFVYANQLNRWQLLRLLPQTFSGSHIHAPQVVYRQATELHITTSTPTPIQADGEIIEPSATAIHYRLLPRKLRVIG